MTHKQFKAQYVTRTEDYGTLLHVMLAYSPKQGNQAAFSVLVEEDTGRYLGNIVESQLRHGHNEALYFRRNKVNYYLAWLKPLPKRVDKK